MNQTFLRMNGVKSFLAGFHQLMTLAEGYSRTVWEIRSRCKGWVFLGSSHGCETVVQSFADYFDQRMVTPYVVVMIIE
jgi:hypothetical protein